MWKMWVDRIRGGGTIETNRPDDGVGKVIWEIPGYTGPLRVGPIRLTYPAAKRVTRSKRS